MLILLLLSLLIQPASPASEAAKAYAEANDAFAKAGNDQAANEKTLAAFERAIALDPSKADYHVGKGRTLARLRRYDDAFSAYGAALKLEPNNPMILRYRGHNYINVKRLDDALADLTKAEAMKKDDNGIYYHLALAHYLKGNYAEAATAYEGCVRTAPATDEGPVACKAWQYLALRRAGRAADAQKVLETVNADLKVTEGAAYLDRLLLFKGVKTEAEAAKRMEEGPLQVSTAGYGIGMWHLLNGRPDRAKEYFTKATASDAWNAFGFVASDVELKRMK
ncbi:MAG: tetratricopeptide repeat protein [Vicinamibacterales bacterium]